MNRRRTKRALQKFSEVSRTHLIRRKEWPVVIHHALKSGYSMAELRHIRKNESLSYTNIQSQSRSGRAKSKAKAVILEVGNVDQIIAETLKKKADHHHG